MPNIERSKSGFRSFNWFNYDSFPDSNGYKFELYIEGKVTVTKFISVFYRLFTPFLKNIEIGTSNPDSGIWGDFCIDTWDVRNDTYDYSPQGKSKETATYLEMLQENGIEPEYNGLCRCHDWDQFLPIILDCIMTGRAPYSLMFYHPLQEFLFYFHHTWSFGVYYKHFNDAIMEILSNAKAENLELYNWNDERTLASLKGQISTKL